MYSKDWSFKLDYRRQPGRRLAEYVCTDKNPEIEQTAQK
jgi:hypothetical protein